MKNYFSFNLTAGKLFPVWILFLIFCIAPYFFIIFRIKSIQADGSSALLFFSLLLFVVVIAFVLTFYMVKLTIENVGLLDKTIEFNGKVAKYAGVVLLGFFLSIITLGIYIAWYTRNINRFFIDNSSYNSQPFKFQGKGGQLFVILLLTIILPMILLTILMGKFMVSDAGQGSSVLVIMQVLMIFIMIPYIYFVYKWMVNIDYKNYNISWKTNFWHSCAKITAEIVLTIITIGIYYPLAMIRLYKYFMERTAARASDAELLFGYDIDQLNDFLFIWGQTLLSIITLGIYYPWAFCKIGKRILEKTYLIKD